MFSLKMFIKLGRFIGFFFLPIFLMLFVASTAMAQVQVFITIKGNVERYGEKLGGASVVLYKDSQVENKIITGTNGKFKFDLTEAGKEYVIEVSKPNHVTVKLGVSTKLPEKFRGYDVGGEFVINMEIFEKFEGLNTTILNKPIAIIKYIEKENRFDYDHNYFNSIKNQLYQLNDQVEVKLEQGVKPLMESSNAEVEKAKAEAIRLAAVTKKTGQEAEAKALLELKEKEAGNVKDVADKKTKQETEVKALSEINSKAASEANALKNKQELDLQNRKNADNQEKGMETDAIRLQKEKQLKDLESKQNSNVKKEYESELLKVVADNERKNKELELERKKSQTNANAAIERKERESLVTMGYAPLLSERNKQKAKTIYNRQVKVIQVKNLIETAAFAERGTKISTSNGPSDTNEWEFIPVIIEEILTEDYKTVLTTTVHYSHKSDIYRKEKYWWRVEEHFKNNKAIEANIYDAELEKLKKKKKE